MRRLLICALLSVGLPAATTPTVNLGWTDTANPSGVTYSVYRSAGVCVGPIQLSSAMKLASGLTALTYSDTTAAIGSSYCYGVTATVNGVESAPASGSVTVGPAAPTNLVISVTI